MRKITLVLGIAMSISLQAQQKKTPKVIQSYKTEISGAQLNEVKATPNYINSIASIDSKNQIHCLSWVEDYSYRGNLPKYLIMSEGTDIPITVRLGHEHGLKDLQLVPFQNGMMVCGESYTEKYKLQGFVQFFSFQGKPLAGFSAAHTTPFKALNTSAGPAVIFHTKKNIRWGEAAFTPKDSSGNWVMATFNEKYIPTFTLLDVPTSFEYSTITNVGCSDQGTIALTFTKPELQGADHNDAWLVVLKMSGAFNNMTGLSAGELTYTEFRSFHIQGNTLYALIMSNNTNLNDLEPDGKVGKELIKHAVQMAGDLNDQFFYLVRYHLDEVKIRDYMPVLADGFIPNGEGRSWHFEDGFRIYHNVPGQKLQYDELNMPDRKIKESKLKYFMVNNSTVVQLESGPIGHQKPFTSVPLQWHILEVH